MPDRTEYYAELRAKYPQLPDSHWQDMQREDALRDERDALRDALAHLISYHTATGTAVPVEKLRAILAPPAEESTTELSELRKAAFPASPAAPEPKVHGAGCPPGCCGAGVRQWR